MAHGARVRPAGTWTNGSNILPSELESLDASQAAAINGDAGGTWTPTSPIIVGGSGMQAPAHTRTRLVSCMEYCAACAITSKSSTGVLVEALNANGYGCPEGYISNSTTSISTYNLIYVPLNSALENGSTIASVVLNYQTATHTALPAAFPFFGVYALGATLNTTGPDGTFSHPLLSTSWVTDSAANVAAYSALNRQLVLTPDQNQTVDRANWNYFAVIGDESGTNSQAGNKYVSLVVNLTNVTSLGT